MIVRGRAGTSESVMKKCKDGLSDFRRGERTSSALLHAVVILGSAFFAASLFGCPARDLGFDLVRVPTTAYLAFDGGPRAGGPDGGDGGRPDAAGALVQCFPVPPDDDGDFEASDDFTDCPASRGDDAIDVPTTQRHRDRDEAVCCYRHGRRPRPKSAPMEEE